MNIVTLTKKCTFNLLGRGIYLTYEELLIEADCNNLVTKEKPLRANKGRIKGKRIAIRKNMTQAEKARVLAEELGHYYTAVGDILDQSSPANRKQELRGTNYRIQPASRSAWYY